MHVAEQNFRTALTAQAWERVRMRTRDAEAEHIRREDS